MFKFLKRMMLLAALLVPWATQAQTLESYGFTTGTDASKWVDMASATEILTPATSGSDSKASAVVNIGFSFPFAGTNYTQYSVNTDGNLRLGSTVTGTSSYTTPFSSSYANQNNPKINAFGCDGYGVSGSHYVKALSMELTSGDSVLVVEFCMGTYNSNTRNFLYKWQIQLYEDGNIDIVFPSASGIPATAPAVAHQCGLCVNSQDGWIITSATNSAEHFNAGTTTTNASGTWFDANRYYTFIHPSNISCPSPTGVTAADVTSNSANLSWTRGGTETTWELAVTTAGETPAYQYTTDTFYTLSGLDANTVYSASVRAICGVGDTSYASSVTFRTLCEAVATDSLPWVYGFDDASGTGATATFNPCLGRYRVGTTSAFPYTSSSYVHTGSYSLYMYGSTSAHSWLTLPLFEDNIEDLYLTFWVYKTSANYGRWMVGVMSDPEDISTFDTIASGQANAVSTWELIEVPLSSYAGNGGYLTILCPMGVLCYTYLDDITVSMPPACQTPSDIVATNATAHTVDLTWTSSASEFIVEYGMQGFTIGTGDSLVANNNSLTLNGLTMGLTYGVYVTAICGDDTSNAAYGTFTAGCSALTSDDLPYTETFEAYGTGATNPINACWTKGTSSSTAYPYPYSTAAITGNRGLYFYGYRPSSATGTLVYSWAALPQLDENLDVSNLMLTFDMKRYSSTTDYYKPCVLYIGIADSVNGFNSAAALDTLVTWIDTADMTNAAASAIESFEVSFDAYEGNGKYVVMYAPVPELIGTSTYAYNYVYVDNVTLRNIPNCFWPSEVFVDGVSSDEATIAWTPDPRTPNPSGWYVEYGPHGFTPGEGEQLTVNDTVVTLTDLVPQTAYDVYVSADCGSDVSEAVLVSFMTSDVAAEMPYFTSFEDGQDSAWVLLNANQTNQWVINNLDEQNGNALFISNNGTTNNYSHSASNVFAMRTFEIAESGDLAIRFDWRAYGESTYDYIRAFIVPTSVDITPGETNGITATATPQDWINIGSFNNAVKLNLSDTWNSNVTILHIDEENTGFYKLVFFWHNDGSGGLQPPAAIDNIEVRMLTCTQPADLVLVNAETDQIDIAWTPTGDESQWQVRNGDGAWEDVYDTAYSATNLTSYTEYSFYVRAVCGDGDTSFVTGPLMVMTPRDCGLGSFNIVDTIGDGTSASSSYAFYNSTSYRTGFTSSIFTVQELNGMGLQVNNRINGIKLHSGTTGGTIRNAKVYLMETQLDGFSSTPANDTVFRDTMTLVYSGDLVVPANSWVNIPFTTPFSYSGNNNLLITMARDTTATAAVTFYYTNTTPDYISCYGYRSSATAAQNYVYRTYYRPNVVFDICSEIPTCPRPMEVSVLGRSDTSVTIAWENIGSNYQYAIGLDGFDPDNATAIMTTDTFAVINGLTQNTSYDFYVRTICGSDLISEWSIASHILTPCSAQQLPYTEDFESYGTGSTATISPCWTKGTNSTTAYPYPYATNAVNGQRSLYFYAYHPSTATATPYYSYAALPIFAAPVDTLAVSFSIRRYSSVTDSYTSRIVVGVMTDPSDISTFFPVDTIDLKYEEALSVHNFEVAFDSYTGNGQFIAFYDEVPPLYGTATASYSYLYLDDIVVDYIPSCRRITDVVVDTATETTATIHWTDPNNAGIYEIEYGPEGFAHGTGTSYTVYNNSETITGLVTSQGYDFYVRAICSTTDNGPWSFAANFRTVCGIYAVPFMEDFESYGTGSAFSIDPCWTKGTNSSTAYPYPYATNAVNGIRSLYFYAYRPSSATGTQYYSYAALPEFNVSVDSLELSFKVRRYATTTDLYTTRLLVGVMSDPTDISTFVGIDTIDLKNEAGSSIHDISVTFGSYTGTGKHIAIYDEVPPLYGTSTYSYSYAYVDDIIVDLASPCGRPHSLDANATSNTITISWVDTVGSTQWQIEYGPTGFELGTGTIVTANQNPYTITGLTPSTLYDVYVRSFCSPGVVGGNNSGIFTVSTSQIPASVPYNYDFENAAEWANWQANSNHAYNNWYRGTAIANGGSHSMYVSADSGATYSPYSFNATVNAAAYRDIDFGTTTSSFTLSFDARAGGRVDGFYDGLMVFVVDPSMPVVASTSSITSPWGNVNDLYRVATVRLDTVWHTHTVSIDTVHGVQRLAFFWFNQSTTNTVWAEPAAIDNISIQESSCPRPVATTLNSVGSTSANISWVGPASADYQVIYRQYPGSHPNSYLQANTNNITLAGLEPLTQYAVWVRKICGNDTSLASDAFLFTTDMCDNMMTAINYDSTMTVTTSVYSPIGYSLYNYSYVQTIIDSAYLADAGFDSTTEISAFAFNVGTFNSNSSTKFENMTVYMSNIPSNENLTSDFIHPDATHLFQKVIDSANFNYTESGLQIHGFDSAFHWDGHSNILFSVKRDNGSYSGSQQFVAHTQTAGKMRYVYQDSGPYDPATVSGGYATATAIGDIELYACGVGCSQPTLLTTTTTYNSATLNWASTSATDFEVAVKAATEASWPAEVSVTGATSYAVSGLMPETQYQFRIRAICDAAEGLISSWAEGSFVTDSLPCFAPTALQATDLGYVDATLAWTADASQSQWSIHVWNSTTDTDYVATSNPFTIQNLTASTSYNAAVKSICGGGLVESEYGDTITFTTATCAQVTGVTVSNVTVSTAVVTWTGTATSYEVEYGDHNFSQGTGVTITTSATTVTLTGLDDDTEYDVYVRALCAPGVIGNWSSRQVFTTQEGEETLYTITVTANDPNMGTVTGSGQYPMNATVTLSATPYEGYYFVSWNDGNTNATRTITVTGDASYVATFLPEGSQVENYTITVTSNNDQWGTVSGGGTFPEGTVITITATPNAGYEFVDWNDGNTNATRQITVTGDATYTANFRQHQGIDQLSTVNCQLSIYPNPATDITTIALSGVNGETQITIVDMNGRTVQSETITCDGDCTKRMEVSGLAQGAYFVRVNGENLNMVRKLVVK